MFKKSLLAATLMALSAMVIAAPAMPAVPALAKNAAVQGEIPAALKSATGLTVLKNFPGPSGLTGWVVKEENSGKTIILYSTADKETVLAGVALDRDGNNLTAQYMEKYIPKPDMTAAYDEVSKAAGIVVGSAKAKAEIQVLVDANCGYCKLLHRMLKPAIDAGDVRVHYVPVAILGGDSAAKGAGLLAAKNPLAAMDAAVEGRAEQSTNAAHLEKVSANTALMKRFGFSGTPAVLYKVGKGKDSSVVSAPGLPTMSEMFNQLGVNGHLDELREDPQLSKYLR